MKLFLLRHADAKTEAATDEDRELSDKGVEQSRRAGRFCLQNDVLPGVILHSPLKRAKQTAEAFAKEAGLPRLIAVDWLAPGAKPGQILDELASFAEFGSILLVGHEPDFSELSAALIGLPDATRLHLKKASLTLIELEKPAAGAGTLEFLLPSKLLKE